MEFEGVKTYFSIFYKQIVLYVYILFVKLTSMYVCSAIFFETFTKPLFLTLELDWLPLMFCKHFDIHNSFRFLLTYIKKYNNFYSAHITVKAVFDRHGFH